VSFANRHSACSHACSFPNEVLLPLLWCRARLGRLLGINGGLKGGLSSHPLSPTEKSAELGTRGHVNPKQFSVSFCGAKESEQREDTQNLCFAFQPAEEKKQTEFVLWGSVLDSAIFRSTLLDQFLETECDMPTLVLFPREWLLVPYEEPPQLLHLIFMWHLTVQKKQEDKCGWQCYAHATKKFLEEHDNMFNKVLYKQPQRSSKM